MDALLWLPKLAGPTLMVLGGQDAWLPAEFGERIEKLVRGATRTGPP